MFWLDIESGALPVRAASSFPTRCYGCDTQIPTMCGPVCPRCELLSSHWTWTTMLVVISPLLCHVEAPRVESSTWVTSTREPSSKLKRIYRRGTNARRMQGDI